MSTTMKTPGVYIQEKDAFPGSVVTVETAVPAFIGYTEKAMLNGKTLVNKPVRITSLAAYMEHFGGAFHPQFTISDTSDNSSQHVVTINDKDRTIAYATNHELYMFNSMRFFYSNGGSACYIVAVGTYENNKAPKILKADLLKGLETLEKEQEPTMIVVPDAVKLGDDCYNIYQDVLKHCSKMQSRIAIFDIYDGYKNRGEAPDDIITNFRKKIGTKNLSYGTAYYPWLYTSIVEKEALTFENLAPTVKLKDLLPETNAQTLITNYELAPTIASTSEESTGGKSENERRNFHLDLLATSPTYERLLDKLHSIMNLMPPSGAMAGIYTMVDANRGVWKAPANVSVSSVIKPAVAITHDAQENLNVDAVSGKSINAIRTFPGVGTMVWGARTLDGNSLDWRYINVRRTIIMIEQSIKLALGAYVFEPNVANTWVTVKSMIANFLTEKWKQGALAGSVPEDAYSVNVGLGNTMTSEDILEGKMLVSVKLAIVRPAEFIIMTFEQQMQKS